MLEFMASPLSPKQAVRKDGSVAPDFPIKVRLISFMASPCLRVACKSKWYNRTISFFCMLAAGG